MPTERKYLAGSTVTLPSRATLSLTVIEFTQPDRASDEIDDTDLSSTVKKSFSGNVVDEGELALTVRYFPGTTDPGSLIPHADETVRITYPLQAGETTAAKWEFTGHFTKVTGIKVGTSDRATASITVKVNSKPVFTAGS
jgi:hypothetical protein